MIYLIIDVHYRESFGKTSANVAGVRFLGIENHQILNQYQISVENVAPYQSGQFYQREMPCLLALLNKIQEPFDVIIIDGYVFLDGLQKAGLGKHLFDNLIEKKPIIGVAKNHFYDISDNDAVYRGTSKHPLYVTCINFHHETAKNLVKNLQGSHRMPDIIKFVDNLSRNKS